MVVAVVSFLAYSYVKIKNRRHCIFFEIKSPRLAVKAETNELLAERFYLKLSFVKWSVLRTKFFNEKLHFSAA